MKFTATEPATGATLELGGKMVIRPESKGLAAARRMITSMTRDLELPEDDSADLLMAVGEAISNAYLHGSPDKISNFIYIGWYFSEATLTVIVEDDGPGFVPGDRNPAAMKDPYRGHGLCLMKQAADEVGFEFRDGTRVVLCKRMGRARTGPVI